MVEQEAQTQNPRRWFLRWRFPFIWPTDETDLRLIHFKAMLRRSTPAHLMPPPKAYFCEHFRISVGNASMGRGVCGACGPMTPDWSENR